MAERALKCPQCNAPLPGTRFTRTALCGFCGATVQLDEADARRVSAARFRESFRQWDDPARSGADETLSLQGAHWARGPLLARGEISDVYLATRARWPTERVLLKVLRDGSDAALFANEWEVLQRLQRSSAPGAATFTVRVPIPVASGVLGPGPQAGAHAHALRWASGFRHTFEAVRAAFPEGALPQASVWMWRRILEVLSFLHASGVVHGAVVPAHLLVQDGDHGVRLVGFSCADAPGRPLRAAVERYEAFYPPPLLSGGTLAPAHDVAMSARCIAFVLGGDAGAAAVPAGVPRPLADVVARAAAGEAGLTDAWALREQLGTLARDVFGPPRFCPVAMPD